MAVVIRGRHDWRRRVLSDEANSLSLPLGVESGCREISETDGLAFGAPVALGPFEDAGA